MIPPRPHSNWRTVWGDPLLWLILLGALALRVVFLPRVGLHFDEYLSLSRSLVIYEGNLLMEGNPTQKPPFFYYLLAGLFKLFGPSENLAVSVNFVSSLVSIALLYILTLQWYGNRGTARLAATFLALSPFHILFSPTILLDPFMIALWLGALVLLGEGSVFWSGILFGCAIATKQQALLGAPLLALFVWREWPREWVRRLGVLCCGTGVIVGALVLWSLARDSYQFNFVTGQIASERAAQEGPLFFLPTPAHFSIVVDRATSWSAYVAQFLSYGWVSICAVLGLVWVAISSARQGNRQLAVADLFCLVWGVSFFVLHLLVNFRFIDRYLLPLVPFFALALARTVYGIPTVWGRMSLGAALLVLAGASYLQIESRADIPGLRKVGLYYEHMPGIREAASDLRGTLNRDSELYCSGLVLDACQWLFYKDLPYGRVRDFSWPKRFLTSDNAELARRRFLLLPTRDPPDRFQRELGTRFKLTLVSTYNSVVVYEIVREASVVKSRSRILNQIENSAD